MHGNSLEGASNQSECVVTVFCTVQCPGGRRLRGSEKSYVSYRAPPGYFYLYLVDCLLLSTCNNPGFRREGMIYPRDPLEPNPRPASAINIYSWGYLIYLLSNRMGASYFDR